MTGPRLSIIPARAATDRALKPRDLQVLCVLGRHTDDLGWCRRSQVKMAEEMGCARSTVFEAIERLVKNGYLEKHEQESENGRDSAHVYRVILDPVHPAVSAVSDADDPCRYIGTPAGISAPPAGPEPAPPAGPGPAPINDPSLTTPRNEEEREAREGEGKDDPKKFEQRVKRLAAENRWPNWANSSTNWTVSRFAELSDAERAEAEAKAAAYLAHCGRRALSLGMYFKDRKFADLPADVVAATNAPPPLIAKPLGKMWSALRLAELLRGPGPMPAPSSFIATLIAQDSEMGRREKQAHQMRHGWPRVNDMHRRAEIGGSVMVSRDDMWLQPIAATFEAVRIGSDLWAAWDAHHARQGWPWVPDPGRQEWAYFPAGGPDGLDAFEQAIRGQGDDGGEREAAE